MSVCKSERFRECLYPDRSRSWRGKRQRLHQDALAVGNYIRKRKIGLPSADLNSGQIPERPILRIREASEVRRGGGGGIARPSALKPA
jgi:hypothetical protein